MQTWSIRVDDIEVGERHRSLSDEAVQRLAGSMRDIGLKQPISVRIADGVLVDGKPCDGVPLLVVGHHRLAAAKLLGWTHIDCIDIEGDEIAAELWEIAENLHRLDLTKKQRDEHIRRYAELLEARREAANTIVTQNAEQLPPRPVGRPKSVITEVAETTGLSRDTIARALNPPPPRAEPPKEVFDVHEQARRRLMNAWNAATESDRQWFRDWIDEPVMDGRLSA